MDNQTTQAMRHIATATGKVVVPADLQADVDQFHYAPARRVGDFVYLSGIVACNRQPAPMSGQAFRDELRQVFRQIENLLAACDAVMADVIELQMFHVFGSGRLALDKAGQLAAIAGVRDEFFSSPYPVAVELAVADLNPDGGLVEIKTVAFAPLPRHG
ncbi:translation initiation inhibitor, yjgF family protein [Phreatobacter stygius]|uniref:Translation initiation inhibitor, yjgF family protein n=2 Tax=Phreatobacter stygius TaxID=1940610 RepID=A0A4D7BMW0_9HYPH|nr:translation initiation inhibitor, yjgF family protein [Phreatobacter stygius]